MQCGMKLAIPYGTTGPVVCAVANSSRRRLLFGPEPQQVLRRPHLYGDAQTCRDIAGTVSVYRYCTSRPKEKRNG